MVCGPGPEARHPWRPRDESAASIGWRSSSDVSSRVAAVSRFSQAWPETDGDPEIVRRLRIILPNCHSLPFDVRTGRCGWHEICGSKFRASTGERFNGQTCRPLTPLRRTPIQLKNGGAQTRTPPEI